MSGTIDWDCYVAMTSVYDDGGFLSIQYDAYGEGNSGVHPAQAKPPLGILSRPLDPVLDPLTGVPNPSKSCELFLAEEGGQTFAVATIDPRNMKALPTLAKGESVFFNSLGMNAYFTATGIALGTLNSTKEPAALGQKTTDALNQISNVLGDIATALTDVAVALTASAGFVVTSGVTAASALQVTNDVVTIQTDLGLLASKIALIKSTVLTLA